MSELTPEDALCLNVLLAGEIQAIRIDEANMAVLVVRSSKTVTVRGELVEPLGARQYWPSTSSGRTVYL